MSAASELTPAVQIAIGVTGGVLLDVYMLIERSRQRVSERPHAGLLYFFVLLFYPSIGGLFCLLYRLDGVTLTAWTSLHVGVSSPTILRGLVGLQARIPVDPGAGA